MANFLELIRVTFRSSVSYRILTLSPGSSPSMAMVSSKLSFVSSLWICRSFVSSKYRIPTSINPSTNSFPLSALVCSNVTCSLLWMIICTSGLTSGTLKSSSRVICVPACFACLHICIFFIKSSIRSRLSIFLLDHFPASRLPKQAGLLDLYFFVPFFDLYR